MTVKRFLLKTLLLVLIPVMMANFVMLSGKNQHSMFSHEKNVIIAYNRLQALKDTNKIVIIAGSNGGFSINSRLISQAFHMPVVNTSTHAGIGVRMQFEMYKELLREGDVVVFCPEYGSQPSRLYGETSLLRILSTHCPSMYKKISLKQWYHVYKYFGEKHSEDVKSVNAKAFTGPYSVDALNEFGDIEWERPHQDSIKPYNLEGKMDKELIAYYKYIHTYSEENGITLLFLPPTFIKSSYKKNAYQIDSVADCLNRNGIPYQASTSRYSFPDTLYFDTPYHMTQEGANLRTELMIEDMRRILRQ